MRKPIAIKSQYEMIVRGPSEADAAGILEHRIDWNAALTSGGVPIDPVLQNPGGIGFRWAADDHLVLTLYRDGFPHLYSIQHPGAGGKPLLLTPGRFMVDQMTLT